MGKTKQHPLREWRIRNGISLREFAGCLARAAGRELISYASLARIENGKQPLSEDVMRGIFVATKGEVTPNDLLGCGGAAR